MRKRIKRHVRGRPREFFIATARGLTALCYDELMSLGLPLENVQVVPGGIEFTGRLPVCYLANLHLRKANRILMRLDQFKATNFRQLHKKTAAFPWELYVYRSTPLAFRVTTKHSRLYHSAAISNTIKTAIIERLANQGVMAEPETGAQYPQQIFVRVVDDTFMVSLDSSGPNLYKRGLKTHHGPAPIRETLANAVLTLAGYDGSQILVDPMCGTGTFTLEAAMITSRIPAGWHRTFSFMGWPAFRPRQWSYLKKQARESMRKIEQPTIFASDADPRLCRVLAQSLATRRLASAVALQCRDFFAIQPSTEIGDTGLVVLNPPYGRRLGTNRQGEQRMHLIAEKLLSDFPGWRLALIVPHKHWLKFLPIDFKKHPLQHGGLHLLLAVGTLPSA